MRHLLILSAIIAALGAAAFWLLRGLRSELASTGSVGNSELRTERVDRAQAAGAAAPIEIVREPVRDHPLPSSTAHEASVQEPWIVRVRVAELAVYPPAAGIPVPGARITLTLVRGDLVTPVGEGTSDGDGRLEIDATAPIAALSDVARDLSRFVATAQAPGFKTAVKGQELAGLEPGVHLLPIAVEQGAMLRGRVVDRTGRGVGRARTVLVHGDERDPSRADESGAFELPIERGGVHTLFAVAPGLGNAVKSLELDPGHDFDVGALELRGLGTLSGRAIDPAGNALADLEIAAVLPGAEGQGPRYAEFAGEGMLRSEARTNLEGRFVLRGLAIPGPYSVFAPFAAKCTEPAGHHDHETGEEGIELVVEIYRLRVRVVDDTGAPLPGTNLVVRGRTQRTGSVTRPDGVYEMTGLAGETWTVHASAPRCLPADARHTFVAGRSVDEVTLVLRRVGAERGALRLVWPPAPAVTCDAATLDVRTPLGSLVEGRYRVEIGADGLLDSLVPGRFRVTVRPGRTEFRGFAEMTWFFVETHDVEIAADSETQVALEGRCGGRVRLTVRTPDPFSLETLQSLRFQQIAGAGAPRPLNPFVRSGEDGTVELGGAVLPDVPLVSAHLHEPGVHTLRVEADGVAPVERTYTIRAGTYTDVELALSLE